MDWGLTYLTHSYRGTSSPFNQTCESLYVASLSVNNNTPQLKTHLQLQIFTKNEQNNFILYSKLIDKNQ